MTIFVSSCRNKLTKKYAKKNRTPCKLLKKIDYGRSKYLNSCGLQAFINLCNYSANLTFENISEEERAVRNTLITVTLGCLHNITNENGKKH